MFGEMFMNEVSDHKGAATQGLTVDKKGHGF